MLSLSWRSAATPAAAQMDARGPATSCMNADRAFLDTNVLVYLFDHDEPAKTRRARELLAQAKPGELVLSAQVLSEFFVVVTRKLKRPLDPVVALRAVDWLSLLRVVALDPRSSRLRFRPVVHRSSPTGTD